MQYDEILILGAGWTATFLIPLLRRHKITFAATTPDGRTVAGAPTIRFRFDPSKLEAEQPQLLAPLPHARYIIITFPLKGPDESRVLAEAYRLTHSCQARFIQLGSTGIWKEDPAQKPWLDRTSPYDDKADARAVAEDVLREMGGCVLNLAGLWGGERDPRHWVGRVAATKAAVRGKTSLHMVHGEDVARVILWLMYRCNEEGGWEKFGKAQRWMVTDGFVYDWWSLFAGWADTAAQQQQHKLVEEGEGRQDGVVMERYGPSIQAKWVYELMKEEGIRALPRGEDRLGRCYDSRELWTMLGIAPLKGGLGL